MKFVLDSTSSDSEGRFKLEMLAYSSNMMHYASNELGHQPAVGELFSLTTSWPAHKSGLGATKEDYETYGEKSATGVFRRIE